MNTCDFFKLVISFSTDHSYCSSWASKNLATSLKLHVYLLPRHVPAGSQEIYDNLVMTRVSGFKLETPPIEAGQIDTQP